MASETDGDAPPRRDDRTMQLDAVAGELDLSASVADDEEQGAERDAEPLPPEGAELPPPVMSAPPPLPSRRRSPKTYVLLALVALLMAALGVGAGLVLLKSAPPPAVPQAGADRPAPARNVVQIGEFVIQPATPPATPPQAPPTKTP